MTSSASSFRWEAPRDSISIARALSSKQDPLPLLGHDVSEGVLEALAVGSVNIAGVYAHRPMMDITHRFAEHFAVLIHAVSRSASNPSSRGRTVRSKVSS